MDVELSACREQLQQVRVCMKKKKRRRSKRLKGGGWGKRGDLVTIIVGLCSTELTHLIVRQVQAALIVDPGNTELRKLEADLKVCAHFSG